MFFSDGESRGISGVAGHICGEEFGVVVACAEVEDGDLVVLHMCGGGSHFVLFLTVQRYEKMLVGLQIFNFDIYLVRGGINRTTILTMPMLSVNQVLLLNDMSSR